MANAPFRAVCGKGLAECFCVPVLGAHHCTCVFLIQKPTKACLGAISCVAQHKVIYMVRNYNMVEDNDISALIGVCYLLV